MFQGVGKTPNQKKKADGHHFYDFALTIVPCLFGIVTAFDFQ